MPDPDDLTCFPIVIDSIHNPVRPKDDLAQPLVFVLGNDAAAFGKVLKTIGLRNQLISEVHCALVIMAQ